MWRALGEAHSRHHDLWLDLLNWPGAGGLETGGDLLGAGTCLMHPDLWVEAWKNAAMAAMERGALGVVAEDCRFENEAVAVRALGDTVLRLDWPGFAQIAEGRVSEHRIADAYPVLNDGEPETLFERLDFVVRRMVAMAGHSADCHSDL